MLLLVSLAIGGVVLWKQAHAANAAMPAIAAVINVPAPSLAAVLGRPATVVSAAGLRSDACRRMPATGHDRQLTVFVDAGHGGVDPGALGETTSGEIVREKDITLAVALNLLPRLQNDGFAVLMSRTADNTVAQLADGDTDTNGFTLSGEHKDTAARIRCANAGNANLLVAIHLNAFEQPSAGGAETIYDSAREFSADNARFAGLIQEGLLSSFSAHGWTVPDRGAKDDADLEGLALSAEAADYGHLLELGPAQAGWLDDPSRMPGALTEPLFVTDRHEANLALTSDGRDAMAQGIEQAIVRYFAGESPGPSKD